MSCTEIHCKTYKFTLYVNDNDINLNIPIAIVNVSIYSESTYRLALNSYVNFIFHCEESKCIYDV